MELTLRWAERSKKYFEEHKYEVPWKGSDCVGTADPGCPGEPKLAGGATELRSAGQPGAAVPTSSENTHSLFGFVHAGMGVELRQESPLPPLALWLAGDAIETCTVRWTRS